MKEFWVDSNASFLHCFSMVINYFFGDTNDVLTFVVIY